MIEIVVALGLFAVGVSTVALLVLSSLTAGLRSGEENQASLLSQEALDAVRQIRDRSWDALTAAADGATRGLVQGPSGWSFNSIGTSDSLEGGKYTRTVKVEGVNRNSTCSSSTTTACSTDADCPPAEFCKLGNVVTTGGTPNPNTKKITATVSWTGLPAQSHTLARSSYLSKWNFSDWLQTDTSTGQRGFNRSGNAKTGVTVSNNAVSLAKLANTWEIMKDAPAAVGASSIAGGALTFVPNGPYCTDPKGCIFAFRGSSSTSFWRYDISTTCWTGTVGCPPSLPVALGNVGDGGSLAYDGAGYIYALRGGDSVKFWKYDIANTIWSDAPQDLVEPSQRVQYGGSLVHVGGGRFFALLGSSATQVRTGREFFEYNASTNAWTQRADTPCSDYYTTGNLTSGTCGNAAGASLATNGAGAVYAFQGMPGGDGKKSFWCYNDVAGACAGPTTVGSTTAGTWSALPDAPAKVWKGGSLVVVPAGAGAACPDSRGCIFAFEGDPSAPTSAFWRYDIGAGSWAISTTTPPDPPNPPQQPVGVGAALAYDNAGHTYAFRGRNTPTFWRYSLENAVFWEVLANTPCASAAEGSTCGNASGASLASNRAGALYAFQGSPGGFGKSSFWRYDTSTNCWTGSGVPGCPAGIAPAPGQVYKGGSLVFIPAGAGAACLDSGGCIFAFQGNAGGCCTQFWRYNIQAGTWATAPTPPAQPVSGGAALVYDSIGKNIYAFRGNGTNEFWRYNLSTNNWTTQTLNCPCIPAAPAAVNDGGALAFTPSIAGTNCTNSLGCIYAFRGNNTNTFWRFDIGGAWAASPPATTPLPVYDGGALAFDGDQGVSAFQGADPFVGAGSPTFWKYNMAANTWFFQIDTPAPVLQGGSLAHDGSSTLYALQGKGTQAFWKISTGVAPTGTYESSVYDTGITSPNGPDYTTFTFTATMPSPLNGANLQVQLASCSNASGSDLTTCNDTGGWVYQGPTGTSDYFTSCPSLTPCTIPSFHDSKRYFRYKATLTSTSDQKASPTLDDLTITWRRLYP